MDSTTEPELPDPVPEASHPVTPDLPPPGPEAPDIHSTERRRPRPEGSDGNGTADEPHKNAHAPDEDRPPAGPGTPAPQEQTD